MKRLCSSLRRLFAQPALRNQDQVFLICTGIGLALLLAAPRVTSAYGLMALRDALVLGIFSLSCDFLWGKARVLTLGHGVFFGLGAYGLAITNTQLGFNSAEGILVGIACAATLAVVIGYFLIFAGVRLHFFAIISIAVLLIVGQTANSWSAVTGGDVGILGVPALNFSVDGHELDMSGGIQSYLFVVVALAAILFALWGACRGNYGVVLVAIGTNELRAKALGYNTSLYIFAVFVVSAAIAGFSGAIFAATSGVVAPDLFSPLLSTQVILWVAIGGRGTLLGPIVACVLLTRLQQEISSYSTSLWPFIAGVLFLGLIMFAPQGLPGIIVRLNRAVRAEKIKLEVRHD